ncbi:MAG: DUF6807 domain-containing protein [Pirellulaceae bacterium]
MRRCWMAAALLSVLGGPLLQAATFTLEKNAEGVNVLCDGKLFTRYITKSGTKPILWPLIGPTGREMTRGYPMREPQGQEKRDHIHHRSLWFNHGDVNGISFWDETSQGHGRIDHVEYLTLTEGTHATIRTRNEWKAPDERVVCTDERTMIFDADDRTRWIDFRVTVTAPQGPVVFGDTKEGSFGIRVGGGLPVDLNAGGKITNSDGLVDDETWGKRAAWVDYSGRIDGQVVGIAILNHPESLRFPTYWHVRTYGLFAANPFGIRDFLGQPDADGSLTLATGDSFSLYYRVILHTGDAAAGQIAEAFDRYARESVMVQ